MLRKSFAFFTVGFLVLAVCASSFGALVGTATLVKEPPGTAFGAPDAALGAPWVSYILSVQGNAATQATQLQQGQSVVVSTLQAKFNSTASVNLDSEMSNLIQLQNAYAANAHVMSVVQSMMNTLIQAQV